VSNLRIALLAYLLLTPVVTVGAATTTTVVDIPSRGALQRILYVEPEAPVANIIEIPGGTGIFGIRDDGTVTFGCGPTTRNRQAYADRGYAVALVDQTSRGSVYNLIDLTAVVDYMRARHDVPTWIFGGSASTETSVLLANALPAERPVGLVVFGPQNVAASLLAQVTRPSLVIFHVADVGIFPNAIYDGLTSAPVRELIPVTTGNGSGSGCSSFHLFNGADDAYVAGTAGFVARHNGSFTVSPVAARAVEFYNGSLDHYFITHIVNEIALLDAGTTIRGWTRTGQWFNVYTAASAGSSPVCRFYIPPGKGDSHFYGRGTTECEATGAANPTFVNEDPQFFHVLLPAVGICPAGTRNVHRVFSNRADANHRYTVDASIRDQMTGRGWIAEGDGPDLVVMCAPL
jgi:hypothetical protein